jgi:predicted PurR-regulated permease PerM
MSSPASSPAISHALFLLLVVLVGWLHLATLVLTLLFACLALRALSFGRYRWTALAAFIVLLALFFCGFVVFVKEAIVVLPEIVSTSVPKVVKYATGHGVELPFTDLDSLKTLAIETAHKTVGYLGNFARLATKEFLYLVVGIVVAIGLFLRSSHKEEPAAPTLYSIHAARVRELFRSFYQSFERVMGAQVIISTINTVLTSIFVLACHLPYATVVIILTFLCGLLPVVGNILSNTLIVGLAFTISPRLAGWALLFLVVIHKLEYFLNSRIIGSRIRHPMWLTLLALLVGERLLGIPGIILAPVVLNFVKTEASKFPADVARENAPEAA